jgi:hypothetical protein
VVVIFSVVEDVLSGVVVDDVDSSVVCVADSVDVLMVVFDSDVVASGVVDVDESALVIV